MMKILAFPGADPDQKFDPLTMGGTRRLYRRRRNLGQIPLASYPQSIIKRPLLDYSPIFLASLLYLTNLALSVHYYRAYKINNTLLAFNEDVKKLSYTLKRNRFPDHLINKVIKAYLDRVNNSTTLCKDSDRTSDGICPLCPTGRN